MGPASLEIEMCWVGMYWGGADAARGSLLAVVSGVPQLPMAIRR